MRAAPTRSTTTSRGSNGAPPRSAPRVRSDGAARRDRRAARRGGTDRGAAAAGRHPRRPTDRCHRADADPRTTRRSPSPPSSTSRRSSSTASSRSPTAATCWRPGSPRKRAPARRSWSAPTASSWSRRPRRSSGSPMAPSAPPPLDEGVLASITRDRLLEAIPGIEEGAWTLDEVKGVLRGLSRLDRRARSRRSPRSTASHSPPPPGRSPVEAQAAFAAARDAELEADTDNA